mgnify:CR=1 FL=1
MSHDFVRRLANSGYVYRPAGSVGDRLHIDFTMLGLLMAISAYGLIILYSAVGQETGPIVSQLGKLGVATVAMLVLAQISPVFYMRIAPWLYALGVGLLILVPFFGTEVNNARRWLVIPGVFGFQPSELMKLVVPLVLAGYFQHRHLPPKPRHVFWTLVIILVPVVLIERQPDLGTAVLIGASGILVLILAGVRRRMIFGAVALGVMLAPLLWFVMKPYQRGRILTLLDPERDPLGAGWNTIQAKTAIGSGGLTGKGLFNGTQSNLDFLPESQTDFILAVLAEEQGLLGVVVLMILYLLLTGRGVIMSIEAQDTFGRLLAGSLTFTFFVYVFVNVGMVSGLLPVVGVPLPLVSFGGTSIVTLFAGFGLLMSVHTHRRIMM